MQAKTAPGPIYNPLPRVCSTEKSLRNITFGTGPARYNDRPESNKRRVPCQVNHPGPQTYDPEAIRRAIYRQSKQRNDAGIKFSTGKRDCNSETNKKHQYPSPAEYDPEMIKRGVMFSKSGTTYIKFGTARINNTKCDSKPGPQTYDPEAIKRGIMLTKSKNPSSKFGSPPKKKKKNCKREKSSPGPQGYDTENIRRGVYCLSTKRRPAGIKFATGPRAFDVEERERASKPGPSAYAIPSTIGPQLNSRYKSQPRISFGSR
eukprot:CAMPEP_0195510316 /NCGR_PEP_ID=MMETSP0794_2-20130614/2998_1 /TAXON_ID=515487 /ORGANISM="Stephanopyxis turris, Strain CCMP 815" /LENGTH=260 /DNA_ID=CAMNT_0040637715 /DNA_START=236 /DNA_END=1018 /DNA_ORIENTATION=+